MTTLKFIILAVLEQEEGNNVLCLIFYSKANLLNKKEKNMVFLKIFIDNTGHCNYSVKQNKWNRRKFISIEDFKYYKLENFAFFSMQDEKIVFQFLGKEYKRYYALNSIISRQNFILYQKALERNDKVNIFIKKIKEVPENFGLWINTILGSDERYIYVKDTIDSNMSSCFCSCCKQKSYFKKMSLNYDKMICPICHEEKSIKKVYDNREFAYKKIFYIQKDIENELIVRIFKLNLIIKDSWNIQYNLEEIYRSYISFDKNKNIKIANYEIDYYAQWNRTRTEFTGIYDESYLYIENLNQVLEGTPYQFSSLLEAAIHINNLKPIDYLKVYMEYPYIEYLVKLKFYKLTEIILTKKLLSNLNPNGKTITEVLKLPKQWIKLAQKLNVNDDELKIIQIAASNPIKTNTKINPNDSKKETAVYISEETIMWFLSNYTNKFNIINIFKVFMEILQYVPQKKAIRYIKEQSSIRTKEELLSDETLKKVIMDWRDYLIFYRALNINLKSRFASMPKNLFKSHNAIMEYSLNNKNSICNNQIINMYEKLKNKYEFQDEKFMVVVPKSAIEIINEGTMLHHCVGKPEQDYIKNMANGYNVILFIRKTEYPEKSYCTLEISNTEVLQIIGYDNKHVLNLDLENFMNKWKNHIKLLLEKIS